MSSEDQASAPHRPLPTDRVSIHGQIRILCSLAEVGGPQRQAVHNAAVAQHSGRGEDSVSETLSFLAGVGLTSGGRGRYAATPAGHKFASLWQIDSARARILLREVYRNHWSARAATTLLANSPLPQEELARLLQRGLAGQKRRGTYLVDWLVTALIVHRDKRLHLSLPDTTGSPRAEEPDEATHGAPQHTEDEPTDGLIMGLTLDQLLAFPVEQYVGVLSGVVQSLQALDSQRRATT